MLDNLNILITNDDGYKAKGIAVLARMMRRFGKVTVVAPKRHQSGASVAVSLATGPIAYRVLSQAPGETWAYLDATPASCVKFAIDEVFKGGKPDVVVSGVNHGSNAATAEVYSGTLGAAAEGALNGIPGIGVSIDALGTDPDLDAAEAVFPRIFTKLMENLPDRRGVYYNINFPDLPLSRLKGVRVGHQGQGYWVKQFRPWDSDTFLKRGWSDSVPSTQSSDEDRANEELYLMAGDFVDQSPVDDLLADHHLLAAGYVSVVAHNIDSSDPLEIGRLGTTGLDIDF